MFQPDQRWAVAVSGGGDSVALLHMLLKAGYGPRLVVLHYNHKWSPWGDKAETFVRRLCARHKLNLVIGQGRGRSATNAEETARKARYAFFSREVTRHRLAGVLLAHTQTDDVEGFLMRLARGSAVKGLSGMAADSTMAGLRLKRPLLAETRASLRTYLKTHRHRYLNDPSNTAADTFRARIRKLLPHLEKAGLHPHHIAASMASLRAADTALDMASDAVWKDTLLHQGVNTCRLSRSALLNQPEEMIVRLMQRAIHETSSVFPLPRRSQLVACKTAIKTQESGHRPMGTTDWTWTKTAIDIHSVPDVSVASSDRRSAVQSEDDAS